MGSVLIILWFIHAGEWISFWRALFTISSRSDFAPRSAPSLWIYRVTTSSGKLNGVARRVNFSAGIFLLAIGKRKTLSFSSVDYKNLTGGQIVFTEQLCKLSASLSLNYRDRPQRSRLRDRNWKLHFLRHIRHDCGYLRYGRYILSSNAVNYHHARVYITSAIITEDIGQALKIFLALSNFFFFFFKTLRELAISFHSRHFEKSSINFKLIFQIEFFDSAILRNLNHRLFTVLRLVSICEYKF